MGCLAKNPWGEKNTQKQFGGDLFGVIPFFCGKLYSCTHVKIRWKFKNGISGVTVESILKKNCISDATLEHMDKTTAYEKCIQMQLWKNSFELQHREVLMSKQCWFSDPFHLNFVRQLPGLPWSLL